MRFVYVGVLAALLSRSGAAMDAASDACRLFVSSVLPGLFPYSVITSMLVSRCGGRLPVWVALLLGWCGGSPMGASVTDAAAHSHRQRVFLLAATATMSPMFLLGTVGRWLGSSPAGAAVLASVLLGGLLTGTLASRLVREVPLDASAVLEAPPLSFAQSIDKASWTMLLVCGTMVMWRVFASLLSGWVPETVLLPLITLMEVTTGTAAIARLPVPLVLRTALMAAAAGFGGMAILMQNRAVSPQLPFPFQLGCQAVHGGLSFLLALGMMQLFG